MADNQTINRLLVVRAQNGEEAAFTILFRRWNPKVLGFAYKLLGNPQAARDVAQDTWAAVVKGLQRLDDPALFRAWVFRIAHNKAADEIRGLQKRRKTEQAAKDMEVMQETIKTQDDKIDLAALISALPKEKQALLILFYVEGLTVPELAEVFNIPSGTVKSRLHTAREELKQVYERKAS